MCVYCLFLPTGEGSCTSDLVSWTPVDNAANSLGCENTWPPTCVLIDPQGFHLHDNVKYCLSLRLRGYNTMVTSTSVWYSHTVPTLSTGLLWEIDATTIDLVSIARFLTQLKNQRVKIL